MSARLLTWGMMLAAALPATAFGESKFEKDLIKTSSGDLEITFIGHGTLMFEFKGKVIHVDPRSRAANYAELPKADLVLVTHEHGDHMDAKAVGAVSTADTTVLATKVCKDTLKSATVIGNGESKTIAGIKVEAVPAYNLVHKRGNGQPFHPKGSGNGYIISFGDKRVYVAGDTENTPEMKALKDIDVAFLPMNLPYTMTPEMVADAAKAFEPKILYPYHFGKTKLSEIVDLMKGSKTELRLRKME